MTKTHCTVAGFYPIAPDGTAVGLPEDREIDQYIVTSSAEIDILKEPRARDVIMGCAPARYTGPISFVSIGCAGFFASVLRFMDGEARSCRILALETPASFVQQTLDFAELGHGGVGFVAQDSAVVIDLVREETSDSMGNICHCEILSRPAQLAGMAMLAKKFVNKLQTLRSRFPGAKIITFENVSEWAVRLMQTVDAVIQKNGLDLADHWLDTIEYDERHFMTARPLLDLGRHIDLADEHPLIVTCLGAGGRVGIMVFTRHPHDAAATEFAPATALHLGRVSLPREVQPAAVAALQYMDRQYFGRENFFFEWTIQTGVSNA